MKKRKQSNLMAMVLAVLLVLAMVAPLAASLVSDKSVAATGADNVQSLQASGLPVGKAKEIAATLDAYGCGVLTGIEADDNGNGYDLTMYDDVGHTWFATTDYYGNLFMLEDRTE